MKSLIAKRLGALVASMLCASLAAFVLLHHAPGDRARMVANARFGGEGAADPVVIELIRIELGLDRPLLQQFASWFGKAVQLDFGNSFVNARPVSEIVLQAFSSTVPLALLAFIFGLLVAFVLAWVAATHPRSKVDVGVVAIASLGAAIPSFWLGLIFILVFSVQLGLVPAYGHGTVAHAILPTLTLSAWLIASKTRLFRNFLREAMSAPYLDAMRVRGIGAPTLLIRHVLHHVLVAALPVICLDFALLLEGAVLVETVFARPGVGMTLLGALQARDYPVVLGIILAAALAFTSANILADSLALRLDPRLRQARGMGHE